MPTILHIEDDPANRLLVRKLLSVAGIDVVDAQDGLEGIRRACELRPSLVLVDIAIPGLDGYEVTLRLRAEPALQNVPIVAITAEGSRDTSLAVGCDGFLQKPIDARTFAATIQSYLGGHRERPATLAGDEHLRAQSQRIVAHLEEKIAELSDANARLRELDQARREFYRNISHELATPMTPIVGYVRMLSDGELGQLPPAQLKAVRAVDDCAQRLRALIDNLLDVTALETGKMRFMLRDYDFADAVRKELQRAQAGFIDRKLQVALEIPESLSGRGDAARLGRAVTEMIANAGKFTPEGGAVGVRLRRLPTRQFELCVADTGPGVPREARARVFEPFYQADGSVTRLHGGAGVGLAIVRGVAKGHGGDVRVVSPADEHIGGLRFTGAAFYLTIAEQAPSVVGATAS
ncbi:MAG TPA: hybrid sensor histidine kinase/response regulator [Polyangiaceae bacterium]|nr:hybrid sensor histidine kinase/response regulator [Polyangiaceae bacterium]